MGPLTQVALLPILYFRQLQRVVVFLEAQHPVARLAGVAVLPEGRERFADRVAGRRPLQTGVDRDAQPELADAPGIELVELAAGAHIDEARRADLRGDPPEILENRGPGFHLDEDHVGARLQVRPAATDRLVEPVRLRRVGAGNDDKVRVAARGDRRLDLAGRFLDADHRPRAGQLPAAL